MKHRVLEDFLDCISRYLVKLSDTSSESVAPFTPTGDLNDAAFIIHKSPADSWFKNDDEPFYSAFTSKYIGNGNSPFIISSSTVEYCDADQSHAYFSCLISKERNSDNKEDEIEQAGIPENFLKDEPEKVLSDFENSERKSQEDMKEIEKLDDVNRVWNLDGVYGKFIRQKLRNIIEFQQLLDKFDS